MTPSSPPASSIASSVVERACVGRPARDLPGQRLRSLEARVHDRDDPDASGVRLERGQVVPVGDVTTADDPEPQRRTRRPGHGGQAD